MFIDRAVVEVRSGKGGDGAIAFLREKYMPNGGPAGGNGGRGASIIFKANSHINTLYNFRHSRTFIGPDGEKGGIKNQYGKSRDDLIIDVPVGTVIFEENDNRVLGDLNEDGKTIVVAKGGRGGRGNTCFKSSTNRTPKVAENGEPGETKRLILELKLLADVGLVGYPSVGKSTLLSLVSSARPEIADYPFTTIVPNLGVVTSKDGRSFVMADLPGLIEGAHQGKGLGLRFLRHIERCRVIVHIVNMGLSDRDPYSDYLIINNELKSYGFGLDKRPVILVASKMDEEGAKERLVKFQKQVNLPIIPISAITEEGLDKLLYQCADLLDKTPAFPLYGENEEELEHKIYELPEEEKTFTIRRMDAHRWRIEGDKIIKFYRMTNISTDEGMMVLMMKIRKLQIDDALEKLGASDGDTVFLDDFSFEYWR
ncbi:MAG TPA: GTPase ObgE [Bacilli bacterium]|nr:GTPase ObgE [Bacilli bacterium]HPS18694.1 GTPase ObgE [Bacilli bacterium]